MMQIPTDQNALMQSLGAYAFSHAADEFAARLQTLAGVPSDRIFTAIETLYAHRDLLDADGLILLAQLTGFALDHHWDTPNAPGRMQAIFGSAMAAAGEGTLPLDFEQPEPNLLFRDDGLDWRGEITPQLDQLKALRRKAVNEQKAKRSNMPAPTPFGPVDGDDSSKIKMTGAVTMALLAQAAGAPFEIDWTMADNTVQTCDAPTIQQMGMAAGVYVSSVHGRARHLKAAIDATETEEELRAIDIDAGWPEPGL